MFVWEPPASVLSGALDPGKMLCLRSGSGAHGCRGVPARGPPRDTAKASVRTRAHARLTPVYPASSPTPPVLKLQASPLPASHALMVASSLLQQSEARHPQRGCWKVT